MRSTKVLEAALSDSSGRYWRRFQSFIFHFPCHDSSRFGGSTFYVCCPSILLERLYDKIVLVRTSLLSIMRPCPPDTNVLHPLCALHLQVLVYRVMQTCKHEYRHVKSRGWAINSMTRKCYLVRHTACKRSQNLVACWCRKALPQQK